MAAREREAALGLEPAQRTVEIEFIPGAIDDEMDCLDAEPRAAGAADWTR